jgi:hypothetical protein
MPLPTELEGKSAEEVYAALSQEHVKEVEQVRKDILDKLPSLKQEEKVTEKPVYQQPYVGQTTPTQEDVTMYSNPELYVQQRIDAAIAGVVGNYATNARPTNEMVFVQNLDVEDRDTYETYKAEVNSYMNRLDARGQADPRAYGVAFNVVLGEHRKEIEAKRFDKKAEDLVKETLRSKGLLDEDAIEAAFAPKEIIPVRQSLFQPSLGVANIPQPRRTGQNTSVKVSPKINDLQRKIAKGFGMSDTEYMTEFNQGDNDE